MNDFTKDELATIYCNLCVNEKTKDILIKIEGMIDNYCDHSHDVLPVYTGTGDIPLAAYCYECNNPVHRKFINELD